MPAVSVSLTRPRRPFSLILAACLALPLSACDPGPTTSKEEAADKQQSATAANQPTEQKVSGVNLDYMDTSVDPAEDFYRYANGTWLKTTEIPADKARYGSFVILRDKARRDVKAIVQSAGEQPEADTQGSEAQQIADFYESYMDTQTIETLGLSRLKPLLAAIDQVEDYGQLAAYFAEANRRGVTTPWGFYIDQDEKQPDRYIPYFSQSGLGLPDREYYLKDDEESQKTQQAYRDHIATMFELVGLPDGEAAAQRIYTLEKALAEAHWPRAQLRDREKTYNKFNQDQLADDTDALPWPAYFRTADLETADEIIISTPSYFEDLDGLFKKFSLADWRNYLKWHTVSAYADLLPTEIDQADFAFYGTVLRGIQQQEERWKQAISMANSLLGDPIGRLYVEKHFPPAAKARMEELVENLREAYRHSINNLTWMTEPTKKKAIEKLEKFTPKIGYPEEWQDLSDLEIRPGDLLGNYIRAREFYYQYEVDKLGQPVNEKEWFMNPQTVNAYYNPSMNEIVFPAAILQPPFFNMKADDAVNYGGIGGVIGHEMGHGFDDQGAKSNGDGLLKNWWTDEDLVEFERRTDKLVEQYNNYTVLDGLHLNGELTQGENIGDLGGLTIAYKAYQIAQEDNPAPKMDGFTGEQRFFLGWAQIWANKYRPEELRRRVLTDPHAPPRFRTNGVLRNMPEFYEAFDVQEGDGMYLPPEQRVKIW